MAMPWGPVLMPDLQVGLLTSVLRESGHEPYGLSGHVGWLDHLTGQVGDGALERYEAVAGRLSGLGVGDWIFADAAFGGRPQRRVDRYRRYLRDNGVAAERVEHILDMRATVPAFLADCAEQILTAGARVAWFTGRDVPALALARELKRLDPRCRTVLTGPACAGTAGEALIRSFEQVDAVVRGETEPVVADLVDALLVGRPAGAISGLCTRRGDTVEVVPEAAAPRTDMAALPVPDYDEFYRRLGCSRMGLMLLARLTMPLEYSRAQGAKAPDQALGELEDLARRYKCLDFVAVDPTPDPRYFVDYLPRVAARLPGLRMVYEGRADLSRAQVQALYAAGVRTVRPDIEDVDVRGLRLLKYCAELGIDVRWTLVVGRPGTSARGYAELADLLPLLGHLPAPSLATLSVDRAGPYHDAPAEHGLELVGAVDSYPHVYDVDAATQAELAHSFRYRYAVPQERPPLDRLAALVRRWRDGDAAGGLTERDGPGYVLVMDRRPGRAPTNLALAGPRLAAYRALEHGGTLTDAVAGARVAAGHARVSPITVDRWLAEWTAAALLYRDGDQYLTLATRELALSDRDRTGLEAFEWRPLVAHPCGR